MTLEPRGRTSHQGSQVNLWAGAKLFRGSANRSSRRVSGAVYFSGGAMGLWVMPPKGPNSFVLFDCKSRRKFKQSC